MKRIFALLLAGFLMLRAACSVNPQAEVEDAVQKRDPAGVQVGAILIHDRNSGYDMAHIEGLTKACSSLGIPEKNIQFQYNVYEEEVALDAAETLIRGGCDIIFSNSFGHQDYMAQIAREHPDLTVVACTGDQAAASGLENFKNIFPYTYESRYISGVVAGLKLEEMMQRGALEAPHIGYVGAYPMPEVISGYSAFFLGVRSVVPAVHMDVKYTYQWFDPEGEAAAAQELLDRGCVIIGQHTDSTGAPSRVQAAYDAGKEVYSIGYNVDMLAVAPDAALTSAQNVWSVLYHRVLETFLAGEPIPSDLSAGAADGAQTISVFGPHVAEQTKRVVDQTWEHLKDGSLHVFDTSTFRCQPGSYYVLDAQDHVTSAYALDTDGDGVPDSGEAIMDGYFAESLLRSAPYFSLPIIGIRVID